MLYFIHGNQEVFYDEMAELRQWRRWIRLRNVWSRLICWLRFRHYSEHPRRLKQNNIVRIGRGSRVRFRCGRMVVRLNWTMPWETLLVEAWELSNLIPMFKHPATRPGSGSAWPQDSSAVESRLTQSSNEPNLVTWCLSLLCRNNACCQMPASWRSWRPPHMNSACAF